MHGSRKLPELYLYAGTGYFNAFTTRIQKVVGDKVHYAFSSAFSVHPDSKIGDPTNLEAMIGTKGDHGENCIPEWYCPETCDSVLSSQSSKDIASTSTSNSTLFDFVLGMYLVYRYGKGQNITVVYEGASADNLTHTVHLQDGTKIDVHDSNLQLLDQPDFLNIP